MKISMNVELHANFTIKCIMATYFAHNITSSDILISSGLHKYMRESVSRKLCLYFRYSDIWLQLTEYLFAFSLSSFLCHLYLCFFKKQRAINVLKDSSKEA